MCKDTGYDDAHFAFTPKESGCILRSWSTFLVSFDDIGRIGESNPRYLLLIYGGDYDPSTNISYSFLRHFLLIVGAWEPFVSVVISAENGFANTDSAFTVRL